MSASLPTIFYERLFERWGPQGWWPAETSFEMMLGAILTQNTSWRQVELALERLGRVAAFTPEAIAALPAEQLAGCVRPAGYFNQKTRAIQTMARTILERFGSLENLFRMETPALRRELLSWRGVGPETADSILLYAAGRPVFVIDAYTRRMLLRHRLCEPKASYDELAGWFTGALPEKAQLFNEYHALIVRLGKEHCRARPVCDGCPLSGYLP